MRYAPLDPISSRLDELEALATQLSAQSISQSDVTSVQSLPSELLSEVFLQVLQPPGPSIAFFLGKICRSWRELAWSSPSLWDTVDLQLSAVRYHEQASLFNDWVSRAKHRPLSIRITGSGDERHWVKEPFKEIISVIIEHSQQIVSLSLFIPSTSYDQLEALDNNLPNMTTLFIRPPSSQCVRDALAMFEHSPQLTNAHIHHFYLSDIYLPWHQLTTVRGDGFFPHEGLTILQTCPNLVHLRLHGMLSADDFDDEGENVIHPSLHSLQITASANYEVSCIFLHAFLPGLKKLEIEISNEKISSPVLFLSFVRRSHFPLEVLSLDQFALKESDFIEALELLPSLVTLTIICPAWNDGSSLSTDFIDRLNQNNRHFMDSTVFLPVLQTFRYTGPVSFDAEDVATMLKSRWEISTARSNPPHLKSFEITTDRLDIPKHVEEDLKSWISAGFDLSFRIIGEGQRLMWIWADD